MIPSKKVLKALLKDEKAAVKQYKDLGWFGLARQEERHKNFIKALLKNKGR